MNPLALLLPALAWMTFFFWATRFFIFLQGMSRVRKLRQYSPAPDPLPKLAVIVPSLNEEAGIRQALESLAAQDYPGLLILPVNDRSTDRTGEIMDEVAARHPGIRPLHITELPSGWLGKNHANAVGAREAHRFGAEWLLFTDGDVQFSRDALRKAMACIKEKGLDHLAVAPELIRGGFGENVFIAAFIVWFMTRFQAWKVENSNTPDFIGIGAFNLVRVEAYEAVGGHAPLALTVADDMALGKRIKEAGFRQGYLEGDGEVKVRWQAGLGAAVRGLYKNSFASLDFSIVKAVFITLFLLVMNVGVYLFPFLTTGLTAGAAWLGLLLFFAGFFRTALSLGSTIPEAIATALCAGFGGLLFAWAMFASMAITLKNGGVTWRGTFYPLRLLKENQVRL